MPGDKGARKAPLHGALHGCHSRLLGRDGEGRPPWQGAANDVVVGISLALYHLYYCYYVIIIITTQSIKKIFYGSCRL